MSRSRFATYVLPAIALAALTGAILQIRSVRTDRPLLEPAITPPSAPANIPASIGAVGLVEAASEEIGLPAAVAGIVAEIAVTPGQKVARGDILFRIDDRQARADLASQQASASISLGAWALCGSGNGICLCHHTSRVIVTARL
jgi:multidrug efflux pump subunit AcrA (membrane-fusion protein)